MMQSPLLTAALSSFSAWGAVLLSPITLDPSSSSSTPNAALLKATLLLLACRLLLATLRIWSEPDSRDKAIQALLWTCIGTISLWMLAVLFGAPLFELVEETWLAAAFVATLVVFPASCGVGGDGEAWRRVVSSTGRLKTTTERLAYYPLTLGILGAWLGAGALSLDWQTDMQRWPVPVVYGALVGSSAGYAVAVAADHVAEEEGRA
ncbi:GPI biosynthesis protein family Pig-F-domain-containing protein [Fimicolochytrium jonesii]|uniref:GPI biosynthesis protein family Pig-F-domain-containing protein n=1 Tax=Fimicolochytrium jonesii TaxID=1396493 RepID=UPI0022FF055C|nr:GPI biosynthesis protein family Pig-F-domain-containing protein [Fimicolochytrium jonesii]KAI8825588.1 GPI biosynthesis protein family Pig-F-domain-containing protein [Fimicolochytrium jonesii]